MFYWGGGKADGREERGATTEARKHPQVRCRVFALTSCCRGSVRSGSLRGPFRKSRGQKYLRDTKTLFVLFTRILTSLPWSFPEATYMTSDTATE